MPAITCTLSAICGTHLGDTKLVTSISRSPASWSMCTRCTFTSAGTGCFSFCSPSRGPTSTSLAWAGNFMVLLVSAFAIDHAGNGLSALEAPDLARDLRHGLVAQGARRRVRRDRDLG